MLPFDIKSSWEIHHSLYTDINRWENKKLVSFKDKECFLLRFETESHVEKNIIAQVLFFENHSWFEYTFISKITKGKVHFIFLVNKKTDNSLIENLLALQMLKIEDIFTPQC